MWCRAPRIEIHAGGLELVDAAEPPEGSRLREILAWWSPSTNVGERLPEVLVAGLAWEGPENRTLWGWPDEKGRVLLMVADLPPRVCAALPCALSLALSLRRGFAELGSRCLVIGDAFPGRLAMAVVSTFGLRSRVVPVPDIDLPSPQGPSPDVVIEATGTPDGLTRAVSLCRDWGSVYLLGHALAGGPHDHYAHVHRRALSLHQVAFRPWMTADERPVAERGLLRLAEAVKEVAPVSDEALTLYGVPGCEVGLAHREQSGWCRLQIGADGAP